jgi:hypothetical protein
MSSFGMGGFVPQLGVDGRLFEPHRVVNHPLGFFHVVDCVKIRGRHGHGRRGRRPFHYGWGGLTFGCGGICLDFHARKVNLNSDSHDAFGLAFIDDSP